MRGKKKEGKGKKERERRRKKKGGDKEKEGAKREEQKSKETAAEWRGEVCLLLLLPRCWLLSGGGPLIDPPRVYFLSLPPCFPFFLGDIVLLPPSRWTSPREEPPPEANES
jgi:hypothetical protein